MLTVMIFVFLIGYLCIALEHPLKVNKAGTALLTGTILWVLYTFAAPDLIPTASAEEFKEFVCHIIPQIFLFKTFQLLVFFSRVS
mgnify:CR=1 FL=1